MREGKKMPPRAEKLVPSYVEMINDFDDKAPDKSTVVLMGKSMGSRVACHVVAEAMSDLPQSKQYAVVCFGYPLIGINKKIRDEVRLLWYRLRNHACRWKLNFPSIYCRC